MLTGVFGKLSRAVLFFLHTPSTSLASSRDVIFNQKISEDPWFLASVLTTDEQDPPEKLIGCAKYLTGTLAKRRSAPESPRNLGILQGGSWGAHRWFLLLRYQVLLVLYLVKGCCYLGLCSMGQARLLLSRLTMGYSFTHKYVPGRYYKLSLRRGTVLTTTLEYKWTSRQRGLSPHVHFVSSTNINKCKLICQPYLRSHN